MKWSSWQSDTLNHDGSMIPQVEKKLVRIGPIWWFLELDACVVRFVFVLHVDSHHVLELEGFLAQVAPEWPAVGVKYFIVVARLVSVDESQVTCYTAEDLSRRGMGLKVRYENWARCEGSLANCAPAMMRI